MDIAPIPVRGPPEPPAVLCMQPHKHIPLLSLSSERHLPISAYPGSLFKFTFYFAEVLQERGSAPGRRPTGTGSGMLRRDRESRRPDYGHGSV